MSTVMIAKFKSKRDAASAAKLIKKFNSEINLVKEDLWEDIELARLVDEGMKERGQVSLKKVKEKLLK